MLGLGREPKPPSFPRMRESNPVILAKAGIQPLVILAKAGIQTLVILAKAGIQPPVIPAYAGIQPSSFSRMRESNPPSFPRMRESIKVSNNPQKGADNRQNPNAPINIQQLHQPAK